MLIKNKICMQKIDALGTSGVGRKQQHSFALDINLHVFKMSCRFQSNFIL